MRPRFPRCKECGQQVQRLPNKLLFCACGCGARLDKLGMRSHSRFSSNACKKRYYRRQQLQG